MDTTYTRRSVKTVTIGIATYVEGTIGTTKYGQHERVLQGLENYIQHADFLIILCGPQEHINFV